MASAAAISQPVRDHTTPQSVSADSACRLASTAQFTGLYLATVPTQLGASEIDMIAEDRNDNGSPKNWLIPISASCCRTSNATAFDIAAKITVSSTDATTITAMPGAQLSNRAPAAKAIRKTMIVCTMQVSD